MYIYILYILYENYRLFVNNRDAFIEKAIFLVIFLNKSNTRGTQEE